LIGSVEKPKGAVFIVWNPKRALIIFLTVLQKVLANLQSQRRGICRWARNPTLAVLPVKKI